jgi:hypothetical protein
MMKRGKKITYLKLNTSSVKELADPAVEAGGEGLGMNLLTRWEMKLTDIPGMQIRLVVTKVPSNTPSRRIMADSVHSETNGDVLLVLQMDDNVALRTGKLVCRKFLQEIIGTTCEYDINNLQSGTKEDFEPAKMRGHFVEKCQHKYLQLSLSSLNELGKWNFIPSIKYLIELNDRGTLGVAIELKHPCYESAAGKIFLKELLAQNNATHQRISPMEEIAYKEEHRLMSDRSSSHAMSPVNQQLEVTRPSSYRTTTAGAHPKSGRYAILEQSSPYATAPVNQQLGMWQPQSCGRFSSSDISNAYDVPPHAHGQYVNYQQFQYGNYQPWMSFGLEQPNI